MLNKHKLFLLCAKWIPVVTAIGILVTNTIAYYGCNDIVVDIFNFNIGTSVAGVILMYVCSYAFNFWDVYVALNAQYHDNIELYKEWFGEDNIENIKDKIIESAIVNWFEDEDAGIEKVWNYFRAI